MLTTVEHRCRFVVVVKYAHKFFDTLLFQGWSLIPFPLNVGWTQWLAFNREKRAEVMAYSFETGLKSTAQCLVLLTLGKPAATVWGGSGSASERRGAEVSCQQPWEWGSHLGRAPLAPVKPSDEADLVNILPAVSWDTLQQNSPHSWPSGSTQGGKCLLF